MEIYDFVDYKLFLREKIKNFPRGGRGQLKKLSEHLNVNSVVISQIFKGTREFTSEQGFETSEFLALSDHEREYFLLMVQFGRASTHRFKKHLREKLEELKTKSKEIKTRVTSTLELSDEAKALFYSQWYYSGISLLTGIEKFRTIEAISEKLSLPRNLVRKVMDFLLAHGLCIESEDGFRIGSRVTHLESTSNLVGRHHTNWRLKGIEKIQAAEPEELFYTGPMVLSKSLQNEIRKKLVQTIEENIKLLKNSPDETMMCLNIDWFKI